MLSTVSQPPAENRQREKRKTGTKILRLEMDQAKMNENENLKPREILILPKVKFQKLCTPPQNGPQASAWKYGKKGRQEKMD